MNHLISCSRDQRFRIGLKLLGPLDHRTYRCSRDQRFRIGLKPLPGLPPGPTRPGSRDQRFRIGLKLDVWVEGSLGDGSRDQRFRIGLSASIAWGVFSLAKTFDDDLVTQERSRKIHSLRCSVGEGRYRWACGLSGRGSAIHALPLLSGRRWVPGAGAAGSAALGLGLGSGIRCG